MGREKRHAIAEVLAAEEKIAYAGCMVLFARQGSRDGKPTP